MADDRRLFETNFWGIVNGCRLAVPALLRTGGVRLSVFLSNHFPTASDWLTAKVLGKQQLANRPADPSYEGLHETRGGFHTSEGDVDRDRHVQKVSLSGVARRRPITTTALVAAAAAGMAAAVKMHDSD